MRLFISLNLNLRVKKELIKFTNPLKAKFRDVHFIPPENWHFTILFLGKQEQNTLPLIIKLVKETALSFKSPKIVFNGIDYIPKSNPRMIWLATEKKTSEQLGKIKFFLEDKLYKLNFKRPKREYSAHLTLVRFRQSFQEFESEKNIPPVEKLTPAYFYPKALSLMQSFLKREGAVYKQLAKFDFKRKA